MYPMYKCSQMLWLRLEYPSVRNHCHIIFFVFVCLFVCFIEKRVCHFSIMLVNLELLLKVSASSYFQCVVNNFSKLWHKSDDYTFL